MARFAVKTLEFDKVKNMLASKAATFLGKQAIISLQIESEFSRLSACRRKLRKRCAFWMKADVFPSAVRSILLLT